MKTSQKQTNTTKRKSAQKKTKQQRVKGRLSAEIRSKYYDTKYVSISTSMWFTGVL